MTWDDLQCVDFGKERQKKQLKTTAHRLETPINAPENTKGKYLLSAEQPEHNF